VRLFMQPGAMVSSVHVVEQSRSTERSAKALEIFGMSHRCLTKTQMAALTVLVNRRVDLEIFIKENSELSPNPDAGGTRIRKAWHFLIDRQEVDRVR
jgi:hypothetical protein